MTGYLRGALTASIVWGALLFTTMNNGHNVETAWEDRENLYIDAIDHAYDVLAIVFGEDYDPNRLVMEEVEVTGYSSTPDQTEGDPHETSIQEHVMPGGAAFTDDLDIPYGKRVMVVDGPMVYKNDRKPGRKGLDVWCPDRKVAEKIGRSKRTIIWLSKAEASVRGRREDGEVPRPVQWCAVAPGQPGDR